MKRFALLPTAVGVLSTFLVACGSGTGEETVIVEQNSAQNRRIASENWSREQEQKARSEFNARGLGDPIYSRLSSTPKIDQKQNQPYAPYGMNYQGNGNSSSGQLLKVGALGLVMMAITSGFNGEKAASTLGLGSKTDEPKESQKENKTDAREKNSVTNGTEAPAPSAADLQVKADDKAIGTNGLTFEVESKEPTKTPSDSKEPATQAQAKDDDESFEIAQNDCEGPHDPESTLKDDILKIYEGSESELGGAQ